MDKPVSSPANIAFKPNQKYGAAKTEAPKGAPQVANLHNVEDNFRLPRFQKSSKPVDLDSELTHQQKVDKMLQAQLESQSLQMPSVKRGI